MTKWNDFVSEKLTKIFTESKTVIDIGGDLGLDDRRSNRLKKQNLWLLPYLEKTEYKVLDKVDRFHPDIVADVQHLPFADNSVDAFICNSVLQSVGEPTKAVREIYRCLKPGGQVLFFVPFLYYYYGEEGYYKDYWRFTHDGVDLLMQQAGFKNYETRHIRGPLATIVNLIPFFTETVGNRPFLDWLDQRLKPNSKQVSGYYAYCVK